MDVTVLGSCPIADFGFSGAEILVLLLESLLILKIFPFTVVFTEYALLVCGM